MTTAASTKGNGPLESLMERGDFSLAMVHVFPLLYIRLYVVLYIPLTVFSVLLCSEQAIRTLASGRVDNFTARESFAIETSVNTQGNMCRAAAMEWVCTS